MSLDLINLIVQATGESLFMVAVAALLALSLAGAPSSAYAAGSAPFGGTAAVAPEVLPPPPVVPQQQPSGLSANHRFEDVHFAFDKYSLTEYAQSSLDGDVTTINKLSGSFPSLKVDISGHTDWIGTDAYNQALSERRATAVKDYLVRKGIDAGRIRTYAYGESQPVAPNTTAEGRALNRRAEISTKGE